MNAPLPTLLAAEGSSKGQLALIAVSYALTAAALAAVLGLQLLPALLGGLLVYELVTMIAPLAKRADINRDRAQWAMVFLIATLVVSLLVLAGGAIFGFVQSDSGTLSTLLNRLAEIIDQSRSQLPAWVVAVLPETADELRVAVTTQLRTHATTLQGVGADLARGLVHLLIGMVIGAMVAIAPAFSRANHRPLAAELAARVTRLGTSFRRVVFAQVWIASVNCLLTALYLAAILPLMGVNLPLVKTLIAVTFVCGLLPVVGNLISNTVIVVVSLSQSLFIAMGSLTYLVVIHKLEYFLNARIIGSKIRARAWELLIAMMTMEAAFGIAGLVAAPIYYAYLKDELASRELV